MPTYINKLGYNDSNYKHTNEQDCYNALSHLKKCNTCLKNFKQIFYSSNEQPISEASASTQQILSFLKPPAFVIMWIYIASLIISVLVGIRKK